MHGNIMINFLRLVAIFSLLLLPVSTEAWEAVDVMTGKIIKVEMPALKKDLKKSGSHQIRYRFKNESKTRLGMVTAWLTYCEGPYCLSQRSHNFRLETFSSHGVRHFIPMKR